MPVENTVCRHCGAAFYAKPYKLRAGEGGHCSRACYDGARLSDNPRLTCEQCGASFTTQACYVRRDGRVRFCSQACDKAWKSARRRPATERFWSHVDRAEGDACWEWTAVRDRRGYGRFGVAAGEVVFAHRYSFELHYGPLSADLHTCHHCDNPSCVRPDHLFAGSSWENHADMRAKDRHTRGERSATVKLSAADVLAIRRDYVPRKVPYRALAERYGVSEGAIVAVIARRTWRHLVQSPAGRA